LNKISELLKNTGPGILITAAFIGPGTVTVCLLAGNNFGFALLWTMLFATVTTIVLQEMSARLGLVSGAGLSQAIRQSIHLPVIRHVTFALIFTGILLGNAAYEAGNISGTLIGIRMVVDVDIPSFLLNLLVYLPAFLLLYLGTFKHIERFFIALVVLMSIAFLATAIMSAPDFLQLLKGFKPSLPSESLLTVVGLIGTTVVPYNLFLHADVIRQKWQNVHDLPLVKKDTIIAVTIGGLISGCIIITGASFAGTEIRGISELSVPFTQMYGSAGKYLFGFGIFAAGFTSTITAPLAASLVAKGLFGWDHESDRNKIRTVWITILTTGYILASVGYKPIEIIKIAQFANGLLLPLIAGFLIWVVNRKSLMGQFVNSTLQNILAVFVLFVTLILGMKGVGLI
jgi:manganese transport protein